MNVDLRWAQGQVFCSDKRFRVLVAGRRFGKTYLALVELCQAAWGPGRLAWYVAPTYKQAKRIAWKSAQSADAALLGQAPEGDRFEYPADHGWHDRAARWRPL